MPSNRHWRAVVTVLALGRADWAFPWVDRPLVSSPGPHSSLVDLKVDPCDGDIYFGSNSDIEIGLLGLLMDL